ncbi:MAG: hypothetical protein BGP06_06220 [Rhizobiales bacterium 65-9]|nr:hypothetical protein [Hyphomicrobiales bacterium]OJY35446.1 MAG: hypothetical protein BGP06_06220 [Rhizobiales bacterium 65-9]
MAQPGSIATSSGDEDTGQSLMARIQRLEDEIKALLAEADLALARHAAFLKAIRRNARRRWSARGTEPARFVSPTLH